VLDVPFVTSTRTDPILQPFQGMDAEGVAVDAVTMHAAGHAFYQAANGVGLAR
jgi:hypothetical protein